MNLPKLNPVIVFAIKVVGLYLIWLILYEFVFHPSGKIDKLVIDNIIASSKIAVEFLGYQTINESPFNESFRTIGIDGGFSLWVGDECDGLVLFALFTGFIIAFPGTLKNKFIFIPIGIIVIHMANILRVICLLIIAFYQPSYLQFNHTYTFTIFVYGTVFILWYLWVTKFNGKPISFQDATK